MPQSAEKDQLLNWGCRLLMTFGIYQLVSGYLSWYQTKRKLRPPLIPQQTIDMILEDSHVFEASLFSAVFFLAGILSFTFSRKVLAFILLGAAAVAYEVIIHVL
jgi:hypothetical protein